MPHLVVDITGWVDAGLAEGGFTATTPVRAIDTRTAGVPSPQSRNPAVRLSGDQTARVGAKVPAWNRL